MNTISDALLQLKQKGYRFSATRNFIFDALSKNNNPLSYTDLQKMFKEKKILANKTTIYRELAFLKEQGIIRELQFNDGIKYYEVMPRDHHHHIICDLCKNINHVELSQDLELQEKLIFKNNKFKVMSHSLEFYGLCKACIKK